jgi:hypothetical protein
MPLAMRRAALLAAEQTAWKARYALCQKSATASRRKACARRLAKSVKRGKSAALIRAGLCEVFMVTPV